MQKKIKFDLTCHHTLKNQWKKKNNENYRLSRKIPSDLGVRNRSQKVQITKEKLIN